MIAADQIGARKLSASILQADSRTDAWYSAIPSIFSFDYKATDLPPVLTALGATYTRNSVKNVVQDGALVALSANQFGTSYDSATGLYGYLAEPAATNRALYSQDPSNAAWEKTNFTATSPITAPDGTSSMYLSTATDSASAFSSQTVVGSAVPYVYSAFVKAGNARYIVLSSFTEAGQHYVIFDTTTATIIATSALATAVTPEEYADGVYRVAFSFTGDESITLLAPLPISDLGAGKPTAGDTCYSWGMQLETGSRATSYIATGAATASRAADVLSVPVANIPGFSSAAYTLFGDVRADTAYSPAAPQHALCVSDNTAGANNALIRRLDSSENWQFVDFTGSVAAVVITSASGTTRSKLAMRCFVNDFAASKNGSIVGTDTSCAMPVSPTSLKIGVDGAGVGSQFNGFIFRAGLVPAALTQAQINGMTS